MPLAGRFSKERLKNELYPLVIDGCRRCGVLQVRETVDRSLLFNPQYCYRSSTIPWLVRYFEEYAEEKSLSSTKTRKRLLEIGCNDGIFLSPLRRAGYDAVGIDASENVALAARSRGLRVHLGFFGREKAEELLNCHGRFDVVACSNVFAHNPAVGDFAEGVDLLLKAGGEFWVEVHSAQALYEGLQWDCFYHEHCFYWTIHALCFFWERYGYRLKSYRTTSMHGGSIRAVFSKGRKRTSISHKRLSSDDWLEFRKRCLRSRELIRSTIRQLPVDYAYGAAGRAVVLIHWTGVADRLKFVVDGSPLRFGKLIPGTMVPIISEREFFGRKRQNGWCFVTAHNYLADIRKKAERHFPSQSIRFITPLPDVRIQ